MKGTNVKLVSFEALCQTRCFQKKYLIYFYSIKMRSLILALNFVPELQLFDIFCINLYLDIWWVSLSLLTFLEWEPLITTIKCQMFPDRDTSRLRMSQKLAFLQFCRSSILDFWQIYWSHNLFFQNEKCSILFIETLESYCQLP